LAILAVAVIIAALAVVMLTWSAADGGIDEIERLASFLRDHDDRQGKIVVTAIAGGFVAVMLGVLLQELRRPARQLMRVRNVGSGTAAISTKDIAERIEHEVLSVEHVSSCAAFVVKRGDRVEIDLDLHVGPGAQLANTAGEVIARTDRLVTERIGVPVTRPPRARLHYRELRLRSVPPPRAQPFRMAGAEGEEENRGDAERQA